MSPHGACSYPRRPCAWVVWIMIAFVCGVSHAYGPPLNKRDIAGLWKLTQTKPRPPPPVYYPMKEFTVYPKEKERQTEKLLSSGASVLDEDEEQEEILLMLKEDGSFQQYAENDATQEVVIPDSLKFHATDEAVLQRYFGNIRGQWAFADGKLYLAAERPHNIQVPEDTLLVGKVVATSGDSLQGNPALLKNRNTTTTTTNSESNQEDQVSSQQSSLGTGGGGGGGGGVVDKYLSVPKGSVNVGKFTYPRNHPAFFDQPMFSPIPKGTFQLKQVLGSLNARNHKAEDEMVEKFRVKDFYDKLFLLTASPIGDYKPKGKLRWSLKQNKMVEDLPKKAKQEQEEEENRPTMIRVMEVKFFANNTFATTGGLGEAILRGKFDIIGHDRDQLWMQIWRFGFGRSVSGSVFSEGNSLSKEDEKTYWGQISYESDEKNENDKEPTAKRSLGTGPADKNDNDTPPRLQVTGSVIYGYGLEPQPVARFIMREATEQTNLDEDDDDDEDEEDDGNDEPPNIDNKDNGGVDWTDAFQ